MAYADPEKRRAYEREYRKKEKRKAYVREYRKTEKRKAQRSEYGKKYYAANIDKERKRSADGQRRRRAENREAVLSYAREYYYRRKDDPKVKAQTRKYAAKGRAKNRLKQQAYRKKYYQQHKEHFLAFVHVRHARIAKATIGDRNAILRLIRHIKTCPHVRCHWCRKWIPSGKRTIDHAVPITKGGAHSVENIVPACAACNYSKADKMPHVFCEHKGFILPGRIKMPTTFKFAAPCPKCQSKTVLTEVVEDNALMMTPPVQIVQCSNPCCRAIYIATLCVDVEVWPPKKVDYPPLKLKQ